MTEVLCTAITAAATIICAFIAYNNEKRGKKEDARAEQRAKEGRLQLAMTAANNELSIATAIAVRDGHTNGEMKRGLEAVEKAQHDYRQFLENIAIDQMRV